MAPAVAELGPSASEQGAASIAPRTVANVEQSTWNSHSPQEEPAIPTGAATSPFTDPPADSHSGPLGAPLPLALPSSQYSPGGPQSASSCGAPSQLAPLPSGTAQPSTTTAGGSSTTMPMLPGSGGGPCGGSSGPVVQYGSSSQTVRPHRALASPLYQQVNSELANMPAAPVGTSYPTANSLPASFEAAGAKQRMLSLVGPGGTAVMARSDAEAAGGVTGGNRALPGSDVGIRALSLLLEGDNGSSDISVPSDALSAGNTASATTSPANTNSRRDLCAHNAAAEGAANAGPVPLAAALAQEQHQRPQRLVQQHVQQGAAMPNPHAAASALAPPGRPGRAAAQTLTATGLLVSMPPPPPPPPQLQLPPPSDPPPTTQAPAAPLQAARAAAAWAEGRAGSSSAPAAGSRRNLASAPADTRDSQRGGGGGGGGGVRAPEAMPPGLPLVVAAASAERAHLAAGASAAEAAWSGSLGIDTAARSTDASGAPAGSGSSADANGVAAAGGSLGAGGAVYTRAAAPHAHLTVYGDSRLPYQAARRISQVALLHLLQSGSAAAHHVPVHSLPTLDLSALCADITALRWIGQGGGGAVFQGVWQGAPVAVKFMLTDSDAPGSLDAAALEGVLSSLVGHPNVVHTYTYEVTRLTEGSFEERDPAHMSGTLTEPGGRDLLGSLLDTAGTARNGSTPDAANPVAAAAGNANSGTLGRTLSGHRARAAAAAAAAASAAAAAAPSAAGGAATPGAGGGGGGGTSRLAQGTRSALAAAPSEGAQLALGPSAGSEGRARGARVEGEDAEAEGGGAAGGARGRDAGAAGAADKQAIAPQNSALESTFQSDEGFGDPDMTSGRRGWTVRQVLSYLKARPGMYMTHIIQEYCDRGSLLSAIRRGIFRLEPPAPGPPARKQPSQPLSPMSAQASQAGGGPSSSVRFPRRIVLRAILRTARDVAQGMSHLHANGIIHGDLKPGNVLLRGCRGDRRGFVAMVADFGLSKVMTRGDKPLEAHHWSTVTVMAPEVILGRWLKASDVWSYGVLLWSLVTSEPIPYSRLTIPQILLGVSHGTLKLEWPAYAHPSVVRLGRACLATSPEKRPSFEAIVKVLTKIESHVRDELRQHRPQRPTEGAAAATNDS